MSNFFYFVNNSWWMSIDTYLWLRKCIIKFNESFTSSVVANDAPVCYCCCHSFLFPFLTRCWQWWWLLPFPLSQLLPKQNQYSTTCEPISVTNITKSIIHFILKRLCVYTKIRIIFFSKSALDILWSSELILLFRGMAC